MNIHRADKRREPPVYPLPSDKPRMANTFFHIYSASDSPCALHGNDEMVPAWLCAGCGWPRPGASSIDVTLRMRPDQAPLNFVAGTRLSIASRAFLHALGSELVQRDLYVGRVFASNGQELSEWATFHGKCRLIVRGSDHVACRQCSDCGQYAYFAMGKKYLYPAPPIAHALFDAGSLVVAEEAFARSNIKNWPGLYIDELAVVRAPSDGLGELCNA